MKSHTNKRSHAKKRMHTKKRSSQVKKRMHTKKRSQAKKYRGGFGSLSEGEIISKIDKNIQRFQDLKNKNKTKNACLNEQVLNSLIDKMNGLKCGKSEVEESVYGNVVNVDKFEVPLESSTYGNLGQSKESVYAFPFFEDEPPNVPRNTKSKKGEQIVYESREDIGLNQEADNEDELLYTLPKKTNSALQNTNRALQNTNRTPRRPTGNKPNL